MFQLWRGRAPSGAAPNDSAGGQYEEEEDGGHGDVESVSEGWDICGLGEGMRLQRQRWRGCPRRRRRLLAGGFTTAVLPGPGHGGGDQKTRSGRWTRRIGLGVTRSNRLEALQEEENEQQIQRGAQEKT